MISDLYINPSFFCHFSKYSSEHGKMVPDYSSTLVTSNLQLDKWSFVLLSSTPAMCFCWNLLHILLTLVLNFIVDLCYWLSVYSVFTYTRTYFSHLLRAVSATNALFVEQNALISTKKSKNPDCLGVCGFINALNLNKWG